MITVTATVRNMIEEDGELLIAFFELAAYYRVRGAWCAFFRSLAVGTLVRFTHDIDLVIGDAERA